ncbi:MAG: SDR family oxidoreductase [Burkholderiales bacterium]|nr:SDR family oxidoreductase [Burkholderiales bacterium]
MNKIDLEGRVAVITGGARGIGYAVAERFLDSGASVMLWDVLADRLEQARASLATRGRVGIASVDVRSESSVDAARDAALREFGAIDILVNSAGIAGGPLKTWEYSSAEFRDVIDINLNGTWQCCKAVVPAMMKRDYGRIINIASIAGKEGNPNASAYSASKAGVIGLTKSLGKELATTGIRVNAITPAAALTEILQQVNQQHIDYMLSKIPMGRLVKVEELAAMIAWMASEDCSFTTGSVFDASGGRAVY